MLSRLPSALAGAAVALAMTQATAQESYRRPPEEIVRILEAPRLPAVSLDPKRETMLLISRESLPPISDLAQPMLRLGGSRINPNTNGPHGPRVYNGITIKRLADGVETPVNIPAGSDVGFPVWAPDSSRFAFTITRSDGIELWVAETATGKAKAMTPAILNAAAGGAFRWMPDSRTLLCRFVAKDRGQAPVRPAAPTGPVTQQTSGRTAPVRTYQDLLQDAHDEALFDYYMTAQLAYLDAVTGERRDLATPAVYSAAEPSPSGEFLLVARMQRPYSYQVPSDDFPELVEVWSRDGRVVKEIARVPLRDEVPIQGVEKGPRGFNWQDSAPATLTWAEALDEGDPKKKVPHRDRVMVLKAPFDGGATEWFKTEHRFTGLSWMSEPTLAMASEYDRDKRWTRTWLYDTSGGEPRLVWDRSAQDRYNNPGSPLSIRNAFGRSVIRVDNGAVYLSGQGATPEGERPFLDTMSLADFKTSRLWRCEGENYESVVDVLADGRVLTSYETVDEPANFFVRDLSKNSRVAVTKFEHPAPQLKSIRKELVKYKRDDGVDLSATLYLPPNYKEGEKLPLMVWAYPMEFNDASTAGQVSGSPFRFTFFGGISHLFLLTQGYAVMDGATVPVVGDPETVNDTFVTQIVAGAKAAIDKAVEMGVADRDRVAVGGHSYGAFMTANLMAHSDLFKAGIARSGAYNRTLTPFGFQGERRTYWEAVDTYTKLSPFTYANKINEPLLLIHGQMDNNPGTFPMQSERLYHAIKGHGGTARLVMLPYESHGYIARESVMHTQAEMIDWLDRYVKNAEVSPGSK